MFLRGVQRTDARGVARFRTIYPGWYHGRATHIHFQVFLEDGRSVTSQVAFPEGVTRTVYRSALYAGRGENTTVPTNAADFVFRDPAGALPRELCTLSGSVDGGYTAI